VRPTPVMVERELVALERGASILSVIQEVERAGGTAHYRVCDVTDAEAIAALTSEIRQEHGRLDVLIHAAGTERSHLLADKKADEFNLVFDVKADGLFNLLKAAVGVGLRAHPSAAPPRAVVVFSSVAGRFGNAGQTDYSAANDLMCKIVSSMRATHPQTKAIAIDWSAWKGLGMASRGSIPEMMRRAGIDMLDPGAAAPVVRRELVSGGTGGEVLIAHSLGSLLASRDPDGGLDLERANERADHAFPMVGRVTGIDTHLGLTFEVELDPQVEPFLRDHALEGTPLLPGVMGIEGFAEVATLVASRLCSTEGHLRVAVIKDVHFEAPLKFYRQEPRTLVWRALVTPEGSRLVAHVTLTSTRAWQRTPPLYSGEGKGVGAARQHTPLLHSGEGKGVGAARQHTRHFSGRVYLETSADGAAGVQHAAEVPKWNGPATVEPEAIYRVYFHGPAFQVLEGVQARDDRVIGRLRSDLPPITRRADQILTAPRLIELCLQTSGVWEIGKIGALALPTAIEQVVIHAWHESGSPVYAEIEPKTDRDGALTFDARVVDGQGTVYLELQGYRTARLPDPVDDELIAPLAQVSHACSSRSRLQRDTAKGSAS
jgi:3-hydroxymyristoyl/3-hydroxydecanoyl-(acyl carrier protein) dehydratase